MKRIIFIAVSMMLLASCAGDKHLKRGDQYWAIGEYYDASAEYAKAYSKTPSSKKEQRGAIAYRMAEANRLMNYSAKALSSYRNAARYGYTDTLTYYWIGEMLRMQRDYKNAAKSYQEYLKQHPNDAAALIGLKSCEIAPKMKEKGSSYTVREDRTFNARYEDYCPTLSGDQLFFSSTRKEATGDEASGITGMKNGDIFFSKKDDKGKWQKPEALPNSVNTAYDEGACAFTPDGKTMYYTVCRWDAQYPRRAEIWRSERSDATWGKGTKCELSGDTLSNFAHPAVSPDGRYLYFVSDMPGGLGGSDIWRVELGDHGFGAMENMGAPINSPGNERFPTFRPDGELYYSTDGKIGMGGLDIYKAVQDTATGKWSVEIMPSPINSNGDDFGMTFDGLHNRGYFSSNRSNRRGWDKIYTFESPEIIQTVKGWVYEQDGYELPKAVVYMVGDDGTNKKLGMRLDGSFEEVIKPGVHYIMLATCEGYLNYRQSLYLPKNVGSVDTTLQFPLPSATIPVLVRNVFYAFNKPDILPSSQPALNKLTTLLQENPSISIELSSHCDYRGSEAYNERLSQHRAESVVKYLISHGISEKRVLAKGYGKKRPKVITKKFAEMYPFLHAGDTLTEKFIKRLSKSQQDTCNALNRRTEFSVLHTDYGLFDEKGNIKPEALTGKTDTTAVKIAPVTTKNGKTSGKNVKDSIAQKTQKLATKTSKTSVKDTKKTHTKPTSALSKTTLKKSESPKAKTAGTEKLSASASSKTVKPVSKSTEKTTKAVAGTTQTGATENKSATTVSKSKTATSGSAKTETKPTTETEKSATATAKTEVKEKQTVHDSKTSTTTVTATGTATKATPSAAKAGETVTTTSEKPKRTTQSSVKTSEKPAVKAVTTASEPKEQSSTAKTTGTSPEEKPSTAESTKTSAPSSAQKSKTTPAKSGTGTVKPETETTKSETGKAKTKTSSSKSKSVSSKKQKTKSASIATSTTTETENTKSIDEEVAETEEQKKPKYSVRRQQEPTSEASKERLDAKAKTKKEKQTAKLKAKLQKQREKAARKKAKEAQKAKKAAEKAAQKAAKDANNESKPID